MDFTLKQAELSDLLPIRELWGEFHASQPATGDYPRMDDEEKAEWTRLLALRLIDPVTSPFGCFIAYAGDIPIGFLAGDEITRPVGTPRRYGCVYWLYVRPDYRALGVGTALANAGTKWMRDRQLEVIEILAAPDDPQWTARGWTPVATRYIMPVNEMLVGLGNQATHGDDTTTTEPHQPHTEEPTP